MTDKTTIGDRLRKRLARRRQELFQPSQTLSISRETLAEIWPFMTNIWLERAPDCTREGLVRLQCYCRCSIDASRNRNYPTKGIRKRTYNTHACSASVKIVIYPNRTIHIEPKTRHTHDLDFMDQRHLSSGLKRVIVGLLADHDNDKVAVHHLLRDSVDTDAQLAAAGARHVSGERVRAARSLGAQAGRSRSPLLGILTDDANWTKAVQPECPPAREAAEQPHAIEEAPSHRPEPIAQPSWPNTSQTKASVDTRSPSKPEWKASTDVPGTGVLYSATPAPTAQMVRQLEVQSAPSYVSPYRPTHE